ncbi:MAG: hypothetical protein EPN99_04815, partial [Frankiales bacterium]
MIDTDQAGDHETDEEIAMPPVMTRRRFLALGGGLAAVSATGTGALILRGNDPTRVLASSRQVLDVEATRRGVGAAVVERTLTAAPAQVVLGDRTVSTWAFGKLPGPEIRLSAGEVLRARVKNDLAEPTSV